MDFDHWNTFKSFAVCANLRWSSYFGFRSLKPCFQNSSIIPIIVGVATLDFDHWNFCTENKVFPFCVGVATLDFDHWNNVPSFEKITTSGWSSYFGFRSLKLILITTLLSIVGSWSSYFGFRSLKLFLPKIGQTFPHFVGVATLDFDHWNDKPGYAGGRMIVGVATLDFDHWNISMIISFCDVDVGVATLDFDHWNFRINTAITANIVGVATLDFDHWNLWPFLFPAV